VKAALNDPAHMRRTLHAPLPITPHGEVEPGSFGAFITNRQIDRQTDTMNIDNNSLHLTHSVQPKKVHWVDSCTPTVVIKPRHS